MAVYGEMRAAIQSTLEAGILQGSLAAPRDCLPLAIDYIIDCSFEPESQSLLVWAGGSAGLFVQCRISGADLQVVPSIVDAKPPLQEAAQVLYSMSVRTNILQSRTPIQLVLWPRMASTTSSLPAS